MFYAIVLVAAVLVSLVIVAMLSDGQGMDLIPGWWLIEKTPNPTLTTATAALALGLYVGFFVVKDWLDRRP